MEEEEIIRMQMEAADNDMQQTRRRMEEEAESGERRNAVVLPLPNSDIDSNDEWNPFIVEDDVPVVESADVVRTKLGKYKGFQGRSRRTFGGLKFGDHRWSESQYSIHKQSFLRDFISQQCQPWKDSPETYMFVDMFGGLGMWADKFTGEICAGSPLCIYNTLEEEGLNYRGIVFEKDSNRAQDLTDILYNRRDNITVYNKDNRECLATIREMQGDSNPMQQPSLLYFDYTRQADSDHIKSLCRQFPQSDVLIHYSSTAFKRAINCGKCDKAKAHKGNAQYLTYLFGRRYWYINNWDELPHNKFNFVSIYGTNVRSASILPEYGGFDNILHPYDSQRGHELRRKAELTNKEIKEQYG